MRKLFAMALAACMLFAQVCAAEVKPAEEWAEAYPDVYRSYLSNNENSTVIDHVEEYPIIATLYEGMAFSTYYNSARGHTYTLEDVVNTGRPHALANCLSCKTPDYTALVNEMGVGAYSISFEEVLERTRESVSCYNCHGNEAPILQVTHGYLAEAMQGENVGAANLACGQCHVEYHFDKETKAVTLPYAGVSGMHPDAILAHYNEAGFADYVNPRTGTQQIKVQHPEFETFLGQGSVHGQTFTCADCHMGRATARDGSAYVEHAWASPLAKPELVAANCASCHEDLAGFVAGIQEKAEARTVEVGGKLVALTEELAQAVAGGEWDEAALDQVRALNRDAQFYWDFVFVENSEGAHNSKLTHECLDKADAMADQALALIRQ